jgi:hypothetical protein
LSNASPSQRAQTAAALCLLISLALVVATFWITRFGPGGAVEGDSVNLTLATQGVYHEQVLVPHADVYGAGFGYPVVLATSANVSGLLVDGIQTLAPLWLVVVAITALAAYRELNRSWGLGILSVILLLSMPDILFYLLRGSHEKLTWTYSLLILFAVARSYRFASTPPLFVQLILLQYFLFLGMATTSVYFATTLLFGFLTCAVIGSGGARLLRLGGTEPVAPGQFARFLLIAASSAVIVFVVMNYLYPPAASSLLTFRDARDKVLALLFGASEAREPYKNLGRDWMSFQAYLALVLSELLVVLAAASEWLLTARDVIRRGLGRLDPRDRLAFLLFAGYAIQTAVGVLLDFSGFLGLNLQVRLFPALAIVSAPLAARLIFRAFRAPPLARLARSPAPAVAIALLTGGLGIAGMLKSSNEPLLSNLWLFEPYSDQVALRWIDARLEYRRVWIDIWAQARDALRLEHGYGSVPRNVYLVRPELEPTASHVVLSLATVREAARRGVAVPATARENLIYDNGEVRSYHRVPRTPFQR